MDLFMLIPSSVANLDRNFSPQRHSSATVTLRSTAYQLLEFLGGRQRNQHLGMREAAIEVPNLA
jgi:hypothetical protein